MRTVKLEDVLTHDRAGMQGFQLAEPLSEAHHQVAGFYNALLTPARKPSLVEEISRAKSPFSIDVILKDFERLAPEAKRALERGRAAARIRLAELHGEVLA